MTNFEFKGEKFTIYEVDGLWFVEHERTGRPVGLVERTEKSAIEAAQKSVEDQMTLRVVDSFTKIMATYPTRARII